MTAYANHRFHVLDGMRGIAALAVMFSHYFVLSNGKTLLPAAYVSVDFFFILSGFVLCHSYGGKLLQGMNKGDYIARRIGRLSPMMLIGLLVGLAAFFISPYESISVLRSNYIESFLHNMFFLPYFSGQPLNISDLASLGLLFPLDSPLWSVSLEMAVSVCMIGLIRLSDRKLMLICAVSLLMIVLGSVERGLERGEFYLVPNAGWSNGNFMSGYPRVFYGFTLGMLLYRRWSAGIRQGSMSSRTSDLAMSVFLYGVTSIMVCWQILFKGSFYFISAALISPLLILKGASLNVRIPVFNRFSEFLGWMSYPLYCLHIPVSMFIKHSGRQTPMLNGYGTVFCIVATFVVAGSSALALDRLRVQQQATSLLQRGFRALHAVL